MSTTTIGCTHCGQTYELTDEQVPQYAGQTITCTACRRPFTVIVPQTFDVAPQSPPLPSPTQPTADAGAYARQAAYEANPPVAPLHTNGPAIASLITGIVSFCIPVIGSVAAIVLGIVGLTRTKDPRVGGKGQAITGIVLGAVSIFVMPCVLSILLPSLNRARETANRVHCAQNMRQIGKALLLYANTNRGVYPPDLATLLSASPALMPDMLTCPSTTDTAAPSAAALNAGGHLSFTYVPGLGTSSPADAIVLYEPLTNHGSDGTNVLFADGHVEFLLTAEAQPLIAAVEARTNPPRPSGGAPAR